MSGLLERAGRLLDGPLFGNDGPPGPASELVDRVRSDENFSLPEK